MSPNRSDAIVADEDGGHSTDEEMRYYGGHLIAESIAMKENRRRIIACVNACAGISTETLGRIAAEELRLVLP